VIPFSFAFYICVVLLHYWILAFCICCFASFRCCILGIALLLLFSAVVTQLPLLCGSHCYARFSRARMGIIPLSVTVLPLLDYYSALLLCQLRAFQAILPVPGTRAHTLILDVFAPFCVFAPALHVDVCVGRHLLLALFVTFRPRILTAAFGRFGRSLSALNGLRVAPSQTFYAVFSRTERRYYLPWWMCCALCRWSRTLRDAFARAF